MNKNYIQVTSVQPYFDANDLAERVNFFDRNNNLKKFYYEIPFQLKESESEQICDELNSTPSLISSTTTSSQHTELLRLCKRKIILESENQFSYFLKIKFNLNIFLKHLIGFLT